MPQSMRNFRSVLERDIHSVKLHGEFKPENGPKPKMKCRLPSINFQSQNVCFRGDSITSNINTRNKIAGTVEKSFETKNVKMGASESVLIHRKNRLMKVNRENASVFKRLSLRNNVMVQIQVKSINQNVIVLKPKANRSQYVYQQQWFVQSGSLPENRDQTTNCTTPKSSVTGLSFSKTVSGHIDGINPAPVGTVVCPMIYSLAHLESK